MTLQYEFKINTFTKKQNLYNRLRKEIELGKNVTKEIDSLFKDSRIKIIDRDAESLKLELKYKGTHFIDVKKNEIATYNYKDNDYMISYRFRLI